MSNSTRAAWSSARVAWARGALWAHTAVADAPSSSAEAVKRVEIRWISVFALKSLSLGYRLQQQGACSPEVLTKQFFKTLQDSHLVQVHRAGIGLPCAEVQVRYHMVWDEHCSRCCRFSPEGQSPCLDSVSAGLCGIPASADRKVIQQLRKVSCCIGRCFGLHPASRQRAPGPRQIRNPLAWSNLWRIAQSRL